MHPEQPPRVVLLGAGFAGMRPVRAPGRAGVQEHTFRLYHRDDARTLRNHVLAMLEHALAADDPARRRALLTFILVGGGATGVEMAGALAEFRRHVVPRDYRLAADQLR